MIRKRPVQQLLGHCRVPANTNIRRRPAGLPPRLQGSLAACLGSVQVPSELLAGHSLEELTAELGIHSALGFTRQLGFYMHKCGNSLWARIDKLPVLPHSSCSSHTTDPGQGRGALGGRGAVHFGPQSQNLTRPSFLRGCLHPCAKSQALTMHLL